MDLIIPNILNFDNKPAKNSIDKYIPIKPRELNH